MIEYDWRAVIKAVMDHDPWAPVDPITATYGSEVHHTIFLRSTVMGRRQALIHTYLNCVILSPEGHTRAHSRAEDRLKAIRRLVMAYGWRNIVHYYDLVVRAGINRVSQPDTFTQLLARLDLADNELDLWREMSADSIVDAEVARELARLYKLSEDTMQSWRK